MTQLGLFGPAPGAAAQQRHSAGTESQSFQSMITKS